MPRSKLPADHARAAGHRRAPPGCVIANVFHAGDGNLHPLICYDDRVPGELERAKQANEELLHACLRLGGSVTGEHGVGLDKCESLPLQFARGGPELHGPAAARLRSRTRS